MSYEISNGSEPRKIICGMMKELSGNNDLNIVHITLTKTKKHYHKKLTEWYYVLHGKIKIEVDDKIEELKQGEIIKILPNTNHKAWGEAELLVICSPPWTEEDEVIVE